MNYIQVYIMDNFIFLMIIVSTYFIVSMKSSVDKSLKIHMIVNMTLLLLMSINSFYLDYLKELGSTGINVVISQIFYYVTKPLPMVALISMADKNTKRNYIPAVINALVYIVYYFYNSNIVIYEQVMRPQGPVGYFYIITEWVYWIIFLSILNIRFYRESNNNPLGIFLYISVLMTANIIDSTGIRHGMLVKVYAVAFLLYYLIIHVHISQQVNEEKDIKLREQRLSMMLSQIQPHFLYNTLNTITALCRANPKLAEETTVKFSRYLRENMYNMETYDTHPFERELDHIKIYLEIEKLRFGDRLNVEYDIKSTDFHVPVLTLQPIVENAVKHGICKRLEGGTVKIETRKEGRDDIIIISDNGEGFEPETVLNDDREHIGIQNANERLKNTVKTEMEIYSLVGVGTRVTIVIPGEKIKIKQFRGDRREIHSIGR